MSHQRNQEAEARVNRQLGELPTSLEVVCRLMMMLRNPSQENDQVVDVLMSDRDLAMQLVTRLAMRDKEKLQKATGDVDARTEKEIHDTLFEAVLHMGYRAILRLVSALSVGQILSVEMRGYGFAKRELWLHSIAAALATQRFCELLADSNRSDPDPSIGFIAGVMHDIGKAGLNTDLSHHAGEVTSALENPQTSWTTVERQICHIDHAALGALLVKRWKLPDEIIDAIEHHHTPSPSHQLAAIVHIGDYAARYINATGGLQSFRILLNPEALEISQLRLDDIERVILHILHDQETLNLYTSA